MALAYRADQLEKAYVRDGLSLTEMGRRFDVSPQTIGRLLRKRNIPVRARGNPDGRKAQPKLADLSGEPATLRVLTLANLRGWLLDRLEHLAYPESERQRVAGLLDDLRVARQEGERPKVGALLNDWWAIHMLDPTGSQRSFRPSIEGFVKDLETTVRNHKRRNR